MTKELFIECISELQKWDQASARFMEGLDSLDNENRCCCFVYTRQEGLIVKILREAMEDVGELIEYYLYELEYGTKYEEGCITENDIPIDISTPEKLYEVLRADKEARESKKS